MNLNKISYSIGRISDFLILAIMAYFIFVPTYCSADELTDIWLQVNDEYRYTIHTWDGSYYEGRKGLCEVFAERLNEVQGVIY